jgi:antitoxin ParD1/3/4
MTRQSISFTTPNNAWLNTQVQSEEYTSKSEVVNDLIRKARAQQSEIEFIREKLIKSEQSGFTDLNRNEILAKSKEALQRNGKL